MGHMFTLYSALNLKLSYDQSIRSMYGTVQCCNVNVHFK